MPIYEYFCEKCQRVFSDLFPANEEHSLATCPRCGEARCQKRVSRFRRLRGEDERLEEAADRLEMTDPDSPTEIRAMARELGQALDDGIGDEVVQMYDQDQDFLEP